MVTKERTFKRSSKYSKWHRTLPDYCYVMDLDWVEWRNGKGVVALIEVAIRKNEQLLENLIKQKEFEITVLVEIATKLKVPAYVVYHEEDLSIFYVKPLKPNTVWQVMKKKDYAKFIEGL